MKRGKPRTRQLRIIGGQWRGRRFTFPELPGLRPTPDRVRETLFNWLTPVLCGARCLDLFCGSGALGIEALSRGAAEVVFIDRHPLAIHTLHENLKRFNAQGAQLERHESLRWLEQPATAFDIVLLDPPFNKNLLGPACQQLEQGGWLTATAWIYLEAETAWSTAALPKHWEPHREKIAGAVAYRLFHRKSLDLLDDGDSGLLF
ncbi:MAG: 16S rRNA (guanine(966)-N(2))-methyltransferase RsmD [Candidatus Contendobacter odensis]|uniref:Ribosomal RNA small subunit methyltransferase D n=1 Tax=Candidatus Contendibacter odensensis TaxID=1400860 RepID=A0A2G6PG78_9GAMM|nr:MAG: 16S rRNA (guanine(966)-N(2))-methyltransferase RsmD [Candidatus Contendobacter odensis]